MSPYTPLTWVDEVLAASPPKYAIVDDTLGTIAGSATIDLDTAVTTPGTALNAANLNHLEQGLATVEAATIPGILTAKGDLVVASAVDTAAILAVGAAGTYLIPASAETPGMKWAQMITVGTWTSTNWDGDAKTANTTYNITAETEFGIPAGCKMVLANLSATWASFTAWSSTVYIARPADVAPEKAHLIIPLRGSSSAGVYFRACGWVPLDGSGQFAVRTVATAPTVQLTLAGYML